MSISEQGKSTNQQVRIIPLLNWVAVIANLFVFCFVGYSIYESRISIEKGAQVETENLATILDYSLSEKFRRLDFALLTAAREYERQLKQGGIQPTVLTEYLRTSQSSQSELDGLRITDAFGVISYNTNSTGGPAVSLADRDYFIYLRDHPDANNYIGKAIKSRVTGRWVLPIARRLNDLKGNFAGMVYATIWISELTEQFANINIGENGAFYLRDLSFRLITRYPTSDIATADIGTANASAELRQLVSSGINAASYIPEHTADDIARIYSYRMLPAAPLMVIAAKATHTYLLPWYQLTARYIAFNLLFLAVSIFAVRVIRQSWRSHEQATQDLQKTTDILETVTEQSNDWVYWRNEDKTQILYISASAKRFSGYPTSYFIDTPRLIDDMIYPDDRERWDNHTEGLDFHTNEEYRIVTQKGEVRWISHSCRKVKGTDGQSLGRRGSNIDITEKKLAEEALKRSERSFSGIFHSSPVGIAITTIDEGKIIEANEALIQLYGYSREELIGQTSLNLGLWSEASNRSRFLNVIMAEGHVRNWETNQRNKDGHGLAILISGEILQLGEERFLLTVHQDITDRKQSEQSLLVAMQAAEAASKAKSRFLAVMSHELRTPLNGIMGMAQMLMMPGIAEQERTDFAQTINNSGQTLLNLLNDILDHAKIESGKLALQHAPFAPDHLLNEIAALFNESARAKGLTLNVSASNEVTDPSGFLGDEIRLRQILSNLVNNAIKFTEHGSTDISVCLAKSTKTGQAVLRFEVKDSGIGIPKENQEFLFRPFSQIDNSSTRRHEGTGLGLAICMNLVRLMGGNIGIHSEPNQGSTFWFEIPAHKAIPPEDEELKISNPVLPATTDTKWQHIRVLMVDDNLINQKVLAGLLKKMGFANITACINGEDAVNAVKTASANTQPFELVLMDCLMPVMDGFEATEKIRQWETEQKQKPVPIIAITASAYQEDKDKCFACGMDDFLPKPVQISSLTATLLRFIS